MKGTKTLLSYILFIVGFQYKVICSLPPPICEKDHFTCANKDCIPKFWKCDGADDCGDNSDETDGCPVKKADACDDGELQCNNKQCIDITWKCDGENDCGDDSDEANCTTPAVPNEATTTQPTPNRPCAGSSNFRCKNGKCIPRSWTCNKVDDCLDNSDEATDQDPHCVPFDGCKDGYFKCKKTGYCIHKVLVCDGVPFNCGSDDNSDELQCAARTCESHEVRCDNGRCISKQWRCDKQNDCGDGSDERNCTTTTCPTGHLKCVRSGHCVEEKYRCDDWSDCLDGTDEVGCNTTKSSTLKPTNSTTVTKYVLVTVRENITTFQPTPVRTFTTAPSCPRGKYKCKNEKKCLHINWVCDGETDCKGNDDESPEVCSRRCKAADDFKCTNQKCVHKRNRCDGHDQCGDNSDEANCPTSPTVTCSKDTHACKGSSKCIRQANVCDNKKDCPQGDDEGARCGVNECLKNNGNCSNTCKDLPLGFICDCPAGHHLAPHTSRCVDTNECSVFGKCSQACVNYKGSFACQCDRGYTLDPVDRRTCRANGPLPFLVFTNRFDVRRLSVDGKEEKLITTSRSASAVAVNYAEKMIYWADNGLKTISRTPIDGTGTPEVLVRNVRKPEGLDVDWLGQKMYWTDLYNNRISVSNLDGTQSKTVIQGGRHEDIRGVQLYPEKGYIFWTNWGINAKIERANLDGSNKLSVVSTGLLWPTCIAIDRTQDRLYWTDFSSIYSATIHGEGIKEILHGLARPYGIAVFEDHIYWTDFAERTIYKANKFNGKDKVKFIGFSAPLDILVFHPLTQTNVSHPCRHDNGGCSHLCFMKSNKQVVCDCPGLMKLRTDKKTCTGGPTTTTAPTTTTIAPTTTTAPTTKTVSIAVKTKTEKKSIAPTTTTTAPTTTATTTTATSSPTTITKTKIKTLITEPRVEVHDNESQKNSPGEEDKSSTTVYIVVSLACGLVVLVIVIFTVVCYRKKKNHFDLTMVYESQKDVVHEKDEDIHNVETKYVIKNEKTKTKNFENINYNNTEGVPLNAAETGDTVMDDYSGSDNSSDDVCFDDREPIMQNML